MSDGTLDPRHVEERTNLNERLQEQGVIPLDSSLTLGERDALVLSRINDLREKDGDYVILTGDNPNPDEDHPSCLIVCFGCWTLWEEMEFQGSTLEECLEKAVKAKALAKTIKKATET